MAFSEAEKDWLQEVSGKAVEWTADALKVEKKNKKLAEIQIRLEKLTEDLEVANAELTVTWDEDQKKHWWNKSKKEMEWMTGDRDVEVDTVHDLKKGFQVDPVKAKKVQDLHMKLVAIQTEMEEAKEGDEPLFSPKDIERELWTPLVRADIIPSNAVGDKYSQEAQVWNGACEIYQKKLEDYTKKASKYDQVQRGLRIAADTVSLIGTIATESIKAANFEGMSISKEATNKHDAIDKKIGDEENLKDWTQSDVDKFNAGKPPNEQVTLSDVKFHQQHEANLAQAKIAKRDMAYTALAVGFIEGGLKVADKALDSKEKRDGWKIAEAVYDALAKTANNSISAAMAEIKVSDSDLSKQDNYKTMMGQVSNLVNYGFKSGKVVFRAREIADAPDAASAKKAAFAMVASVAGGIGNAFAAFDRAGKPEDGGTEGQWTAVGAYVEAAILGAANAGKIADQIYQTRKNGGKINYGAVAMQFGLAAMGPVMAGTYKPLEEGSRKDDDESGVFKETEAEKDLREKKTTAALQKAGGKQVDPTKLMALFGSEQSADGAKQAKLMKELLADAEAEKQEEINAFREALKDPESDTRREFLSSIQSEVEGAAGALEKLIEETKLPPDDLEDEEKAKRAMDAMDKLIAEAAALNAKWDAVNALTAGGVGILVAALPVAGLAAAIQKLAMDVAILVRKSVELNKWLDNIALTYGNSSVYGPAIAGRVASAKVQVAQQSVRVVFDAIGVSAEACKLADLTGISTGISIGNNMARALTEYGFKMAKEAECDRGWALYKEARANKGDRKLARKAMKWNSTLSKCVLAYGIVMDGDPIAKEVARSCGMTPEVLADQKDVCQKVVTYFETLYSDDAVSLRRVPLKQDWHPGTPTLSNESWWRFKTAAAERASPPISDGSTATPKIDKGFAALRELIGSDANYSKRRDERFPDIDLFETEETRGKKTRRDPEYRAWLDKCSAAASALISALKSYQPVKAPCPDDVATEDRWQGGTVHEGMMDVVDSLIAQAAMLKGEIEFDIQENVALKARLSRGPELVDAIGAAVDEAADAGMGDTPAPTGQQDGDSRDAPVLEPENE